MSKNNKETILPLLNQIVSIEYDLKLYNDAIKQYYILFIIAVIYIYKRNNQQIYIYIVQNVLVN